jgi:hypothetical protein
MNLGFEPFWRNPRVLAVLKARILRASVGSTDAAKDVVARIGRIDRSR